MTGIYRHFHIAADPCRTTLRRPPRGPFSYPWVSTKGVRPSSGRPTTKEGLAKPNLWFATKPMVCNRMVFTKTTAIAKTMKMTTTQTATNKRVATCWISRHHETTKTTGSHGAHNGFPKRRVYCRGVEG